MQPFSKILQSSVLQYFTRTHNASMTLLDYLHTLVNAIIRIFFFLLSVVFNQTLFFKTSSDPEILLQIVKTLPTFQTSCT